MFCPVLDDVWNICHGRLTGLHIHANSQVQFGVMKLSETYLGGAHPVEPPVVLTRFFVLHPTLLLNTRIAPKFCHGHSPQNAIIHPLFYHSTISAATSCK